MTSRKVSSISFFLYKARSFLRRSATFLKRVQTIQVINVVKIVRVVLLHLFLYLELKKSKTTILDCTFKLKSINFKLTKFQSSTYNFYLQFQSRSA